MEFDIGGLSVFVAIPVNRDFAETPGGIPVAVCSNGIHTDFVLPVKTAVIGTIREAFEGGNIKIVK